VRAERGGTLTIGTADPGWLPPLITAVTAAAAASRCLLVLSGGPDGKPTILGVDDGTPPSAESVLAALPPEVTGVRRVADGWIAPVVVNDTLVGAALVEGPHPNAAQRGAGALAAATAETLTDRGAAMTPAHALRTLVDVGHRIHAAEVDTESVLGFIVDQAHELLGADTTWLALADHMRQVSEVTVVRGAQTAEFSEMRVRLGTGLTGIAMSVMETVRLDESQSDKRLPSDVRARLRGEGLVSLICAPLIQRGELIGNLLVGFRRRTAVPPDARYLLTALSSQAATAIANSRLYAALRERNSLLERHSALSRALTEVSLKGGGQHAVASELARALGCNVTVTRLRDDRSTWLYPAAGGEPEPMPQDDGERWPGVPILAESVQAGGEQLGTIHAIGDSAQTEFHRTALGLGATAIALEITKERAVLEVESRVHGELLEELLLAEGTWPDSLRRRAAHAGIDVTEPRVVAVIETLPGGLHSALMTVLRRDGAAAAAEGVLIGRRSDQLIVAVPVRQQPGAWVRAVIQRAAARGVPARAGLSGGHSDLGLALREARAALGLARTVQNAGAVVEADALGPLRFLLDAPDTHHMLRLVRSVLGPLAEYDRRRHGDLLSTLRTFLDTGGNHPVTATRCQVHLNTVKYRLNRAAELLGRPLNEPATRFELSLAFAVADVLEAMKVPPFDGA